jgi:hypothetical protein
MLINLARSCRPCRMYGHHGTPATGITASLFSKIVWSGPVAPQRRSVMAEHIGGGMISIETLAKLFRFTQPGILPSYRDALVVSAIADVGAIVVAELQSLVLAHGDRGRASDTRALLLGQRIF